MNSCYHSIILYSALIESSFRINGSKDIILLVFFGFILILFIMGIIDYFKNKKIKYNYIKKDKENHQQRELYKIKKEKLRNRKRIKRP